MQERILEQLASVGLGVTSAQAATLADFLRLLRRWNTVYNLTSITAADEMIQYHLVESLALRPFLRGERVADVGSGAGLPGVPLAIAEPDRQFTLIESRAKRVRFLRHVQGALRLENVAVAHCRVEGLTRIAAFDTVLARAVAALPDLLGLVEHLMQPGSVLLTLTSGSAGDEPAVAQQGFTARRVEGPIAKLLRGSLVVVEKVGA